MAEGNWKMYERFVAALESKAASDTITVVPNAKLLGAISRTKRQIDLLIDNRVQEDISRRVIVDAKFQRRKLDVKDVESFESMMRDCRADRGILVCANGYTPAALRRAQQAISIRIVSSAELEEMDLSNWEPCLGKCSEEPPMRKERGLVLFDQPFGLAVGDSPLHINVIGKCDRCWEFHVWCLECGKKFAVADESEYCCGCHRFWLTATEEEGTDELGNKLEAVLLFLVLTTPPAAMIADRRPLA